MYTFLVNTAEQMQERGERLGALLSGGQVVVLSGELGAGKTTFVQGVARGMGILGPVTSPTFSLIHVYEGSPRLVHSDFYRLVEAGEVEGIGFYDYLAPDTVVMIEWGEDYVHVLPKGLIHMRLEDTGQGRAVSVWADDLLGDTLLKEWLN